MGEEDGRLHGFRCIVEEEAAGFTEGWGKWPRGKTGDSYNAIY
jgi:hypothetical protein